MLEFEQINIEDYTREKAANIAQLKLKPHATWAEWIQSAEDLHRRAHSKHIDSQTRHYELAYDVAQHGYHGVRSAPTWTDRLPIPENEKDFVATATSLLKSGKLIEDVAIFLMSRDTSLDLGKELKAVVERIHEEQSLPEHIFPSCERLPGEVCLIEISDHFSTMETYHDEWLASFFTDLEVLGDLRPVPSMALRNIAWLLKREKLLDKNDSLDLARKILSYGLIQPFSQEPPPAP